jgi:hypothetical protein
MPASRCADNVAELPFRDSLVPESAASSLAQESEAVEHARKIIAIAKIRLRMMDPVGSLQRRRRGCFHIGFRDDSEEKEIRGFASPALPILSAEQQIRDQPLGLAHENLPIHLHCNHLRNLFFLKPRGRSL